MLDWKKSLNEERLSNIQLYERLVGEVKIQTENELAFIAVFKYKLYA